MHFYVNSWLVGWMNQTSRAFHKNFTPKTYTNLLQESEYQPLFLGHKTLHQTNVYPFFCCYILWVFLEHFYLWKYQNLYSSRGETSSQYLEHTATVVRAKMEQNFKLRKLKNLIAQIPKQSKTTEQQGRHMPKSEQAAAIVFPGCEVLVVYVQRHGAQNT